MLRGGFGIAVIVVLLFCFLIGIGIYARDVNKQMTALRRDIAVNYQRIDSWWAKERLLNKEMAEMLRDLQIGLELNTNDTQIYVEITSEKSRRINEIVEVLEKEQQAFIDAAR